MFGNFKNKWNLLNYKSTGGAMDVIVIEQNDGSLLSTPFYLRISKSYMLTALNLSILVMVNGSVIEGVRMHVTSSGLCHFDVDSKEGEDRSMFTINQMEKSGNLEENKQENLHPNVIHSVKPSQEKNVLSNGMESSVNGMNFPQPYPADQITKTCGTNDHMFNKKVNVPTSSGQIIDPNDIDSAFSQRTKSSVSDLIVDTDDSQISRKVNLSTSTEQRLETYETDSSMFSRGTKSTISDGRVETDDSMMWRKACVATFNSAGTEMDDVVFGLQPPKIDRPCEFDDETSQKVNVSMSSYQKIDTEDSATREATKCSSGEDCAQGNDSNAGMCDDGAPQCRLSLNFASANDSEGKDSHLLRTRSFSEADLHSVFLEDRDDGSASIPVPRDSDRIQHVYTALSVPEKKVSVRSTSSDALVRSFSVDDLVTLQEPGTDPSFSSVEGKEERVDLDGYVRQARISNGLIDCARDVNTKIHDNLLIRLIEISEVRYPELCRERLVDVSKTKWTAIDASNVPMLYDRDNATKLVRLTLTTGKQLYFTAAYLNHKPINFDFVGNVHFLSYSRVSYTKYMNLPSATLRRFNLKSGINQIQYLIRSSKGVSIITASIFKWRYNDRLVISDIDGTVTKSDVLGHIYGLVGMDYSHEGVAHLYSKIVDNGYKLLYVSSRPLSQMQMTRDYMYRVRQGQYNLPRGPILLNSSSVFSVIREELFDRKKVEEFKVNALQRVRTLFPKNYQPFHAAFGNAESDFNAYRFCGIPRRRIFSIDKLGRIAIGKPKTDASATLYTQHLTYTNLAELGNLVFPDAEKHLANFEDYDDLLTWYTSLDPTVEFR